MKKIMFNDKYGLTEAVLKGRKTMTRRIANYRGKKEVFYYSWMKGTVVGEGQNHWIECKDADEMHFEPEVWIKSHFQVGEIVAIAQSYATIGKPVYGAPYKNKMFVKPEDMPHHIRITGIKVEELQDISEEDALREGIIRVDETSRVLGCKPYYTYPGSKFHGETAKAAFISLIDKLRKKPKKQYRELPCEPYNPIVFVYEFELVD